MLLDITGCERLFGGEARLLAALADGLSRLGFQARIAAALTSGCAAAVARFFEPAARWWTDSKRPLPDGRGSDRRARGGQAPPAGRDKSDHDAAFLIQTDDVIAALAPLPVAALRIDARTRASLADVGVHRIGELLRLDRNDLAARFGPGLLRALDAATGAGPDSFDSIRPEPPPVVQMTFDGAVKQMETIERAARELLGRLLEDVHARGRGLLALEVRLHHVDRGETRFELTLTYPSQSARHLWPLLRGRLERANLGFGVESLSLRATDTGPRRPQQTFLWDMGASRSRLAVGMNPIPLKGPAAGRFPVTEGRSPIAEGWCPAPEGRSPASIDRDVGELLDRLIERLGREAVCGFERVESYVPERAFAVAAPRPPGYAKRTGLHEPRGDRAQRADLPRPQASEHRASRRRDSRLRQAAPRRYAASRPTRLFERPEPARVVAIVPDGPPGWIEWRGRSSKVLASRGPERLALPWWDDRRTSAPSRDASDPSRDREGAVSSVPSRDYFAVQLESGRWVWVFRESPAGRWFVHGEWA